MRSWRPEGWANPHTFWKKQAAHTSEYHYREREEKGYEAGANAMLGALKKTGFCNQGIWTVFFPEEDN
jgi:hypothetical protein